MDILRQRRINVLADDSRFMRYCLKRKTEDLAMSNEAAELIEQQREQTIEFGRSELKGPEGNIHGLTIIGQIEGHQVLPENTKTTK